MTSLWVAFEASKASISLHIYSIVTNLKRKQSEVSRFLDFKGTLMYKNLITQQSANIFVFIWKYYVGNFTLEHLLLFEICEKFVYKHTETIEYVTN